MESFWSRLASWLRRRRHASGPDSGAQLPEAVDELPVVERPSLHEETAVETGADIPAAAVDDVLLTDDTPTIADVPASSMGPADETPVHEPRAVPIEVPSPTETGLRIGVDFGTSTIQVAYYLEGREPQLLRLEDATDYMPSYYAKDPSGDDRFGVEAFNLPENEHSIKPKLVKDLPMDLGYPSQIAYLMLEEVVRRTIHQLRAQRLIPEHVATLQVATNLGCTPRFELDARIRLRDVAQRAGLDVGLATLVEEPVAAAFEVMLSGLVADGRVLVIDMGGGTLDIAVIKIADGARSFELFASGGYEHAGDAFTNVIVDRIKEALVGIALNRADETLIWQRAEAAKQALSVRSTTTVALGGIASHQGETLELTNEWFLNATRRLRVLVEHDVKTVYQMARLVLDRGGKFDPAPGTVDFDEPRRGIIRRLTEVGLRDDALEHIDKVVFVGGATNMPMIQRLFGGIFGDRVIEPEIVGIDRSAIVALGLSRPKPPGMSNLRYPNWGISADFDCREGRTELPLYEPFAPSFGIKGGQTSAYVHSVEVPEGARSVSLLFRPIGGQGTRWPAIAIPQGVQSVSFEMDLFGRVGLLSARNTDLIDNLTPRPMAPWAPAEGATVATTWLPPWRKPDWWTDIPVWDLRND